MPTSKQLKVLKASAGSGKTYTLTNENLDLLKGAMHSQILAVTFTNKATEEMKSRIVEELDDRAKKGDSKAKDALDKILHDYSHFNVSTIDKFFQKVMRSMFRELGFNGVYNLILDNKMLVDEIISEMRLTLDKYPNAYKVLLEEALSEIKNGADWNFTKKLEDLSKMLWKDEFLGLTPEELTHYSYDNVEAYYKLCKAEKDKILDDWAEKATRLREAYVLDVDVTPKSKKYVEKIESYINKKQIIFLRHNLK